MDTPVTFSFGKNWKAYLRTVDEDKTNAAVKDIEGWLGKGFVAGKTVLDIGCGSGIHSLAYYLMGAKRIVSFDVDGHSVEATRMLWEQFDRSSAWEIQQGSILDECFMRSLGGYDIVYAWGVLHHTGSLWKALDNTISLINKGGHCWVSIYAKGPNYQKHLALKESFNRASRFGKKMMIGKTIGRKMAKRLLRFQNPFGWNQRKRRGMNSYHDLIDWLGGLPYDVATDAEVVGFCKRKGLVAGKIQVRGEGSPTDYLFSRE